MDKTEIGRLGEDLAVRALEAAGVRVIERNWRAGRRGEIDIIGAEGDGEGDGRILIVEVKTRTSAVCGSALEAVNARKLGRMRRLAGEWLAVRRAGGEGLAVGRASTAGPAIRAADVRFDMVAVDLSRGTDRPVVEWVKDLRP